MENTSARLVQLFRQARRGQCMTQKDIAEKIGISANAYGKIETGMHGLPSDLVGPLCHALHIRPYDAMRALIPDSDPLTRFTPNERKLHEAVAEFLNLDPASDGAIKISDSIMNLLRQSGMRKKQRKEGNENGKQEGEK